ncbi:hypothetical protein JZ751_003132 [Albula glossodonta]|uniref:Ig-like domain-containing protein n=1 Tax=Albula glossodonta TaxID=121402 RepID=A0A8T2NA16_9TELE|nr:hypothetical protein JZ751_003132 [Albula glossodonta]
MRIFYVFMAFLFTTKICDAVTVIQKQSDLLTRMGAASETLQCEHDEATHFTMFWYRQDSGGGLQLIAFSTGQDTVNLEPPFNESKYTMKRPEILKASLQIKNMEARDSAVYFCASNPNIKVTAPTVKVLPPSPQEDCAERRKRKKISKLTLVCVATGFYPDHVSVYWKVNGGIASADEFSTDEEALRDENKKFYSITSRLRIKTKMWFNPENSFTCITNFYDGTGETPYEDTIKGAKEYFLRASQTAKVSYGLFIAKSFLYGLFVCIVVWRLRRPSEKRYD